MQERRTTIRVPYRCRSQYCPSDDLAPRDGILTNLSERGVGLLTQEQQRVGSLVTVGFALPGERDSATATGVVRWSEREPSGRWHPTGLDWIPMDEPTHARLHRFLDRALPDRPAAPARPTGSAWWRRPRTRLTGLVIGIMATGGFLFWIHALQGQNQELESALGERETVITELSQEGERLRLELGTTRRSLEETAGEVAQLDQQAQRFGQEVERLNDEVEQFEHSYVTLQGEREALMRRVLDLEQERLLLHRRLSSVKDLRLAIRDAIEGRRQEARTKRLLIIDAQRRAEQERLVHGNRGFVIRNGQLTAREGTLSIRVHEPAAAD